MKYPYTIDKVLRIKQTGLIVFVDFYLNQIKIKLRTKKRTQK